MQDFHKLSVWQKAHRLTVRIYNVTNTFPKGELYGLTSQIRRAAVSIPANISEGCGRAGQAELGRFLLIAMGSASELEYHVLLARDLEFLKEADYSELNGKILEIKRMLSALIIKLKTEN